MFPELTARRVRISVIQKKYKHKCKKKIKYIRASIAGGLSWISDQNYLYMLHSKTANTLQEMKVSEAHRMLKELVEQAEAAAAAAT